MVSVGDLPERWATARCNACGDKPAILAASFGNQFHSNSVFLCTPCATTLATKLTTFVTPVAI